MKSGLLSKWVLGAAVGGMCITGGCLEKPSTSTPVQTIAATEADADVAVIPAAYEVEAPSLAAPVPEPEVTSADVESTPEPGIVTAPAKAVPGEKAPPPNLRFSGPAMELIKLANSGVDEAVLLSYVTNSTSTFDLGADEIIYLNDIGVPGVVVSTMIQHDQALRLAAANPAPAPTQPAPPPPLPGYPAPAQVAPQPDEASAAYPPLTPPESEVSYGDFYNGLAPYGTWVDVEGYGRCWQPTVVVINPGWQPYFNSGCWAYTDCGWYWHSDYSWGWAPFHYGRWFRHNHWGWCWAPDTVWGPSWVCWRQSSSYCGWAPLPPGCFFTAGVGFTFHGQRVRDFDDFGLRPNDYRFVGWNNFQNRRLHGHAVPHHENAKIFNETFVVNRMVLNNKTVINQGISPQKVANATQREIRQVSLMERSSGRPGAVRGQRTEARQPTVAVFRPQRPRPGMETGDVAERSGVPARQGSAQSVAPAASAPTANPAARVAGEARITPPRTTGRLVATREEAQLSHPPEAGLAATRTPEMRDAAPVPTRPAGVQPTQTPSTRLQGSGQSQAVPVLPQRPLRLPGQPAPSTPTPAQNPATRPAWAQPSAPASTPAPSAQPVQHPNVSRATPWLENRPTTPMPVQQQQFTPPAYVPQRSYTPPPAPTVPMESRPAPSRPVMAEVPRYAPAPAPSRPAVTEAPRYAPPAPSAPQSSGAQTRSAPSAPPASSGNSQRR